VEGVEAPFRWTVKKGELRLNTKEGGVIIGKLEGDILEIKLPGSKTMSFKRAEQ